MTATIDTAAMGQKELRAACKAAEITGYGNMTVAQMREALASATTTVRTMAKTTEPLRKAHAVRTVAIPYGSRLNRHYNDDGSVTLYARGVKVFRTLATEGDDVEIDEDYDAEAEVEKFAHKWFGAAAPVWGKTTHSHNWKNKKKEEAAA